MQPLARSSPTIGSSRELAPLAQKIAPRGVRGGRVLHLVLVRGDLDGPPIVVHPVGEVHGYEGGARARYEPRQPPPHRHVFVPVPFVQEGSLHRPYLFARPVPRWPTAAGSKRRSYSPVGVWGRGAGTGHKILHAAAHEEGRSLEGPRPKLRGLENAVLNRARTAQLVALEAREVIVPDLE